MELGNLGAAVFVRTPPRSLELRWYSPLMFGAVAEILANVVRHMRESCGREGDAGASDGLRRAFGKSIQSTHEFPACCEDDIRISLELVGRAELTVPEHCERLLSAARASALDAATVRTEPWHDGVPAFLAAQIPERVAFEFSEDGLYFFYRTDSEFDSAMSAVAALLTFLFGDRWRDGAGRQSARIRARDLDSLLRAARSQWRWEDDFSIDSEWLFGLRVSGEGSIGLAVSEDRLGQIEEWVRDHGARWGIEMPPSMDID